MLVLVGGCDDKDGGSDAGVDGPEVDGTADAGGEDGDGDLDTADGDSDPADGDRDAAGGGDGEPGALCHPETGLARGLPTCSLDYPCVRLGAEVSGDSLTDPNPQPACDHPELELWQDDQGALERYACVATPVGASADSRRPLVLYFHPGGEGGADTLSSTQLVQRHEDFDLSGDPARPGFVLAAIHGRNLHHPTVAPRDGRHHDFYFRDLSYPSNNDDMAAVDRLVASVADAIDPNRIYVMGWSNGAFFGQLYAIARRADKGQGFQVAAAAVFATGNPFGAIEHNPFTDLDLPFAQCGLEEIPSSDVPILLVYRTCDLPVPCGDSQSVCFGEEPGYQTTRWLSDAAGRLDITPVLISGLEGVLGLMNQDAAECTDFAGNCPAPRNRQQCLADPLQAFCACFFNHEIWPDGVRDENGQAFGADREQDMLEFLRDNPLSR
jgi:hypothetical protein